MNKITHTLAVSAAAILVLAGCSATGETTNSAQGSETTEDTETNNLREATATPLDEPQPAPTNVGDVCDPQNANDFICAAFYPEQALLNVTSAPRADEPLASMTVEQKIDLAQQACDAMAAGGTKEDTILVDTITDKGEFFEEWNNGLVFAAGQLAYCNEFIEAPDGIWRINEYRDMGETAAKESFKDGVTLKP
jgi:hypothetical protein